MVRSSEWWPLSKLILSQKEHLFPAGNDFSQVYTQQRGRELAPQEPLEGVLIRLLSNQHVFFLVISSDPIRFQSWMDESTSICQ